MASEPSAELGVLYERTLDCVHCGLCLQSCPTYRETGRETSSPRGRIYLLRGAAEGRIGFDETVVEEMYACLGCRACETACPSGVEYGALLEDARAEIERRGARKGIARFVEWALLRQVVPHRGRLSGLISVLGVVTWLGLDRLALPFLPKAVRDRHRLMPEVPPRTERRRLPAFTPAEAERRGRVALLEGCVMPELFGATNHATLRVLVKNGFDVVVPPEQGCCGALHAHAGDEETAHALLEKNRAVFEAEEIDALVVNSAGCGAHLRASDPARVRDVSEFLAAAGLRPPEGRVEARVCYDDPCHLVHGQGVSDPPRELLAAIPGVELVSHEDAASCCGAAGIYNLTHPEMSDAVLERKLDALAEAAPDVVATGNPGCLMQILRGARERGLAFRVAHPIDLLDEAYERARGDTR